MSRVGLGTYAWRMALGGTGGSIRTWIGVALAAAAVSGCGGDGAGSKVPGVDAAVIPATLVGFAAANRDRFPTMSIPTWSAADNRVTGFVPEGVDPVVFCQELVTHLGTIGTQGAAVVVTPGPDSSTELASGSVGGTCVAK
jgi:hypothetical protein